MKVRFLTRRDDEVSILTSCLYEVSFFMRFLDEVSIFDEIVVWCFDSDQIPHDVWVFSKACDEASFF